MLLAFSNTATTGLFLVAVAIATSLGAAVNKVAERRATKPQVERAEELDGLKASVAALLPTVAQLVDEKDRLFTEHAQERLRHADEKDRVNAALQECLRRDSDKANSIAQMAMEMLELRRMIKP